MAPWTASKDGGPLAAVHYKFSTLASKQKKVRNAARHGEVGAVISDPKQSTDERGRTALHVAAANHQLTVIQKLRNLNVDVNARDADGRTALQLAREAMPGRVLKHDVIERHAKNVSGWPRRYQFSLDEPPRPQESIALLEKWGRQQRGEVEVHWADADQRRLRNRAREGDLHGVRTLLDRGVAPVTRDENGKTALDLASEEHHRAVADALRAALEAIKDGLVSCDYPANVKKDSLVRMKP